MLPDNKLKAEEAVRSISDMSAFFLIVSTRGSNTTVNVNIKDLSAVVFRDAKKVS